MIAYLRFDTFEIYQNYDELKDALANGDLGSHDLKMDVAEGAQ